MEDAYFRLSRFSCPSPQQAAGYSNKIKNKIKLFVSELKETKMKNRVEDWGQDKDADEKLKAEHLYYI
jgi:hypothetical protein